MNKSTHQLLDRQLRKTGLQAAVPPADAQAWAQFLGLVASAYHQADQDRALNDRAMDLSTQEMSELHAALERHSEDLERQVKQRTAQLTREIHERIEAQAALVKASRQAGMAEIATGVLHNVGNILNSVNVSTDVIRERVQHSATPLLGKTNALLKSHETELGQYITEDPKGRLIPAMLAKVETALVGEQTFVIEELERLKKGVNHIKSIVQSQQAFAKSADQLSEVVLTDAIEDAVRLSELDRGQIEVVRAISPCPPVRTYHHKLLQILVNLLSNARKAVTDHGSGPQRITIRLDVSDGPAGSARLSVTDTGVGISAGNLQKIFQHGFTTRKDGHGFGLHSAANDVHHMGGRLEVHSDGPGTGATFTLVLPIHQPDREKCNS